MQEGESCRGPFTAHPTSGDRTPSKLICFQKERRHKRRGQFSLTPSWTSRIFCRLAALFRRSLLSALYVATLHIRGTSEVGTTLFAGLQIGSGVGLPFVKTSASVGVELA